MIFSMSIGWAEALPPMPAQVAAEAAETVIKSLRR
jgi:hypothetical protein